MTIRPLRERLWARVDKSGGPAACWPFTGHRDRRGYGRIGAGCRGAGIVLAHRAAYEDVVGPIPDGLTIDHLCFNPPCCNPIHMEPVTLAENSRRQAAAAKPATHCRKGGHEFTAETTAYRGRQRLCRLCERASGVRRRALKRATAGPTPVQRDRTARQARYTMLRTAGLSQKQAAADVGVTQACGSLWERRGRVSVASNLRTEAGLGGLRT